MKTSQVRELCREWQKMGPAQIIERAARLSIAFDRYKKLFGEECHGTMRQCAALLELEPLAHAAPLAV